MALPEPDPVAPPVLEAHTASKRVIGAPPSSPAIGSIDTDPAPPVALAMDGAEGATGIGPLWVATGTVSRVQVTPPSVERNR